MNISPGDFWIDSPCFGCDFHETTTKFHHLSSPATLAGLKHSLLVYEKWKCCILSHLWLLLSQMGRDQPCNTQHLPVGHQIGLSIIFLISCPYIPGRAVSLYGFTWKINNYLQMVMFYNDIYFSQPAWQKLFLLTEIIKQTACSLKITLPLALNT